MSTLVHITTQYFQNYGLAENPHWKPKGGQIFTIEADVYDLMYAEESVVKAIQMLLEEKCNTHSKYKYLDHEVIFSKPVELVGFKEKFDMVVNQEKQSTSNIPTDEEWREQERQSEYMNGEYPDEY